MRPVLFVVLVMICGMAAAQPSFGVGMGSGDCQSVVRQIINDWFDVHGIMSSDSSLKRPSASDFRCVSPTSVNGSFPQHAGAAGLSCYKVQQGGVCCDPQLKACAAL
jgi:hypothetical protein